jgi:glycosidase
MDGNAGFGDFMGMKEKLGDLKDMGVNTIWPTPVLNFDKNGLTGEMTVSLDVAEQLGGQQKFKELVKSAHAKDMKVVVDLPLTVADGEDNWVKKSGIQNGLEQSKGELIN